jgi:hypothetical protein
MMAIKHFCVAVTASAAVFMVMGATAANAAVVPDPSYQGGAPTQFVTPYPEFGGGAPAQLVTPYPGWGGGVPTARDS